MRTYPIPTIRVKISGLNVPGRQVCQFEKLDIIVNKARLNKHYQIIYSNLQLGNPHP